MSYIKGTSAMLVERDVVAEMSYIKGPSVMMVERDVVAECPT
jgi:hypothetical protein